MPHKRLPPDLPPGTADLRTPAGLLVERLRLGRPSPFFSSFFSSCCNRRSQRTVTSTAAC